MTESGVEELCRQLPGARTTPVFWSILQRVRNVPPFLLPLVTGTGMIILAAALKAGGCPSCATIVPYWLLGLTGFGWCVVALCLAKGHRSIAAHAAILLFAGHLGLVAMSFQGPCYFCWAFLLAEATSVAVLSKPLLGPERTRPFLRTAYCMLGIGSIGAALLFGVVWKPLPDRMLLGAGDKAGIYIVVRRNCGNCAALEKKFIEVIQGDPSLSGISVAVVDERGTIGKSLVKQYGLTEFPSFIAALPSRTAFAQNGGDVMEFIRRATRRRGPGTGS